MSNEKGGLIKKKKKPIMPPPAPVIKTQAADFSYSPAPAQEEVKQPVKEQKKYGNSAKTIKVPSEIHTQIHLLSPFMDENKAYMILQRLIDSYVANELTDRQQRQFEFMLKMSEEEK